VSSTVYIDLLDLKDELSSIGAAPGFGDSVSCIRSMLMPNIRTLLPVAGRPHMAVEIRAGHGPAPHHFVPLCNHILDF